MPADTPFTDPPATVATAVLVLLHVPPVVASANVIDDPAHTVNVRPVMVPGPHSGIITTWPLPVMELTLLERNVPPQKEPPPPPPPAGDPAPPPPPL